MLPQMINLIGANDNLGLAYKIRRIIGTILIKREK